MQCAVKHEASEQNCVDCSYCDTEQARQQWKQQMVSPGIKHT